jgi:hypothetical protein
VVPARLESQQWLDDEESFETYLPRHQYSVGVVRLFLETVFSCAAGQRTAAAVMELYACWLPGVSDTPCANTGRLWILRLGLYELLRPKQHAQDWVWIMDHTLQLGPYKCLVIVGVRLSVWMQDRRALRHDDLTLLSLTPMEQATGERVHEVMCQTVSVTGVPCEVLTDGGSDLKLGTQMFQAENPAVVHAYDVKHKMALFLKKELEQDPRWACFVTAANQTKLGVNQTPLAFLVPPSLKTKARYMNLDTLVSWGRGVLGFLKRPRINPQAPVDLSKLKDKLGWVRKYRQPLMEWSELLAIANTTEDYVRRHGYHRRASRQLSARLTPLATSAPARRMRAAVLEFIKEQTCAMRSPHERLLGSSEVIESLIGKYKHLQSTHSKGGMTVMLLSFGGSSHNRARRVEKKSGQADAVRSCDSKTASRQEDQHVRERSVPRVRDSRLRI